MRGFDPDFADLPDYILGITERIWEGRDVGAIRRFYHPSCTVHGGLGSATGVDGVIAGTLAKSHQFPDRMILAEDVIWSGDDRAGFLSSHRSMMVQTHLGTGVLGPPTGRRLAFRAIADCAVIENRIYEEWLVVDQGAAAIQAGWSLPELAAEIAARDERAGAPDYALSWTNIRCGPDTRTVQDDPAVALATTAQRAMFGGFDLSVVRRDYLRGVNLHLPSGRDGFGWAALEGFVTGYLASIPDARFEIEHAIAMHAPERTTRVATRWSLTGTHAGEGGFGPPSGAPLTILGITHSEIVDGRIVREWVMVDELAIWCRIARHRLKQAA